MSCPSASTAYFCSNSLIQRCFVRKKRYCNLLERLLQVITPSMQLHISWMIFLIQILGTNMTIHLVYLRLHITANIGPRLLLFWYRRFQLPKHVFFTLGFWRLACFFLIRRRESTRCGSGKLDILVYLQLRELKHWRISATSSPPWVEK